MIRCLQNTTLEERQKKMGLFGLEKSKPRRKLHSDLSNSNAKGKVMKAFSMSTGQKTGSTKLQLQKVKFRLDIRNNS